jgi:hypothetical protein
VQPYAWPQGKQRSVFAVVDDTARAELAVPRPLSLALLRDTVMPRFAGRWAGRRARFDVFWTDPRDGFPLYWTPVTVCGPDGRDVSEHVGVLLVGERECGRGSREVFTATLERLAPDPSAGYQDCLSAARTAAAEGPEGYAIPSQWTPEPERTP